MRLKTIKEKLAQSPLAYRIIHGAFWSLISAVLARGLGLLSSILVARILGKTGFGELGMIQGTIGMFGTFAGFGMGLTATKFIAEYRKKDPIRAGRIRGLSSAFSWITSGITAGILYFMSSWLATNTIAAPHLTGLLQISTIYLFLTAINGAQAGALTGLEAFKTVAKINFWSGIANFPLMVAGVYFAGIPGAVWGMIAATGLNWLLNHIAIRKECAKANIPYTYEGCWAEKRILWEFSLPAVLSGLSAAPLMWAASAYLVNQVDGYAEMGIYNAVLRIKQVPELILTMLTAPILPILSEQFGNRNAEDYTKTLKYIFTTSLLILVPVSLIQMATPSLTFMPFGQDFQGKYSVVQWLMLQTIFTGVFSPISSILSSMNRMWFGFIINLLWGLMYIYLAYYLIPQYGASGLAAASTISHTITSFLAFIYISLIGKSYLSRLPMFRTIFMLFVYFSVCYVSSVYGSILQSTLIGILTSLGFILYIKNNKSLKGNLSNSN